MSDFLENLAEKIILESGNDFSNMVVVLPNKRAGLFLKNELAKKIGKPFFPPSIYSTEDFVQFVTGLKIQSSTFLIFDLFAIHKDIEKENSRSFSEFAHFGDILLSDFNDVDLHLADAENIFTFLNDEKELSLWNPDGTERTDFQENYLHFYRSLIEYYSRINAQLKAKNIAYKGMAYKYLSENLDLTKEKLSGKKILIAGFNALTQSEKALFNYLEENFETQIYWDSDDYYLNSPTQEAGMFLRNYQEHFKAIDECSFHFKEPKTIAILGASDNVLQVKFAGEKMAELLRNKELETPENTAIVLADENLLIPLLNSLPKELDSVNITMGYSFSLSPVHDCVLRILQLHKNRERFKNRGFLYKDLLEVLLHPFLQKIAGKTLQRSQLLNYFSKKNSLYFTLTDILDIFGSFELDFQVTGFLFQNCELADKMPEKLNRLAQQFLNIENLTPPEKEFAYAFYKLSVHLLEIQQQYNPFDSHQSLYGIYHSLAKHFKIPFYGEPLKGLQIMGLLETRAIDFERIILLSANEGKLPPAKGGGSIIPMRIKSIFGMHTYRENDAIYAYHFYRLLQTPKDIHLLFDANEEGMGKKESSRFLKQIRYEMPLYSKNVHISEGIVMANPGHFFEKETICIPKDDSTFAQLEKLSEKGFSPSALGCYLECSLRFYFNYIMKIKEPDTPLGMIDSSMFGSAVHEVLEKIFSPENFENGFVTPQSLEEPIGNVAQRLKNEFLKHYPENQLNEGNNHLSIEVGTQMLLAFLKRQQKVAKENTLKILATEKELSSHKIVQGKTVKILGISDRIEQQNGIVRIADYKTGLVDENHLKIKSEDLVNFNIINFPEKVFQLLCYVWLYRQSELQISQTLQAGIYSMRKQSELLQMASLDGITEFSDTEINLFDSFLQKLLEELFNKDIAFVQTENLKNCEYCAFKNLCER